MDTQERYISKLIKLIGKAVPTMLIIVCSGQVSAGSLNLSDGVLEAVTGVEPNVMILNDDSRSMDWGAITQENDGVINFGTKRYFYTQPDTGVAGGAQAPAINTQTLVPPTEEYLITQGVVAPYLGVWRAWNTDYNKVYYDPEITYVLWSGEDTTGTPYANAMATNALFNPHIPADNGFNLTTTTSYSSDCDAAECVAAGMPATFTVTNFYPARYYTWGTDTNSDGLPDTVGDTDSDGVADAGEPHTLIEIRSSGCSLGATCPSSFIRTKFDVITMIGRSDCGTDNGDGTVTCSYAEEIQNFANWFQYYRKRDLIAKAALSTVIEKATLARIGYTTIHNGNSVNIEVATMDPSTPQGIINKDTVMSRLFSTLPDHSGTPLREPLHEVGRYYECNNENIFGTSASSPGNSDCPVLAAPEGACQANHTILLTDGFYSRDPTNSAQNPDSYMSYNANINNSDNDDNTNWDGDVFGDSYSDTLADVAMYYYENDLHSLNNDVPATQKDVDGYNGSGSFTLDDPMHQHMKTHTIGFGVVGNFSTASLPSLPLDILNSGPWTNPTLGDPEKIDDLLHAGFNGRGYTANANNPVALANVLETIFDVIGTGEGAASAVAFNSQTIQSNSVVYRAFFNLAENSGDLVAQRVNANGTLNTDVNGDPIYEWSAAAQLDTKTGASSDTRTIITYEDNGVSSTGRAFQWTGANTITGPRTTAGTQMNILDNPVPANVTDIGDERLNYLRGHSQDEGLVFDDGEFRIRPSSEGKLGDIVHSTPVYVGKPPFFGRTSGEYPQNAADLYPVFKTANASRQPVVYVGANDGMLHGINADTGDELFAYVPNAVFNKLSDLTSPLYSHQYYVDRTPSINDIFMNSAWHTVLVGGLGNGGTGYYALDITDPSTFNTESNAAANVLWEFTSADDNDLGFSFSDPLITMSNADTDSDGEKDWVAIFGNGYNSTSTDGDAAIFMLFIEEGTDGVWGVNDYVKISTGNGKAESIDGTTPNGIGGLRGIDVNNDGTVDRLYAGDLQGNLYRFDVSDTNENNWDNSSNLDIIFKARYGAPPNRHSTGTIQPITTQPIVIEHPTEPGYIVLLATGSWMTDEDATSTGIQSIYGIWDDDSGNLVTMPSANNQLVEQSFTNQINTEHGFTVRSLTNNNVNYLNSGSSSSRVFGWYIDLDVPPAGSSPPSIEYPGERAVRNLQLRNGILFVNTVIPKSSNVCNKGAGGFELAMNPATGGSGIDVIFDINGDGQFNPDDNIGDVDNPLNIINGIRFDESTPSDSAFIGNVRITQLADMGVRGMGTNPGDDPKTGRNSWREIIEH